MKVILIKDYPLNGIIKRKGTSLEVDKEHFKRLEKFGYIDTGKNISMPEKIETTNLKPKREKKITRR